MTQLLHNASTLNSHVDGLIDKLKQLPICPYDSKEILRATPHKLHEIAQWFDTLDANTKSQFDYIKTAYSNFTNKKAEYDAYDLASNLNINVCPYCNRNFTFTTSSSRPEFDHFYSKDKYPILALSFYNLIPSCHICNSTLKGRDEFTIQSHIHPYLESFNDKAKFTFKPTSADFLHNHASIKVDIDSSDTKALNSIDTFKLRELYAKHSDTVLELIQKSVIYNDSYIDELFTRYEGSLFKNREDLLRLITGGYITDEEIGKRPLSKLIKDIFEQLGLLD